jgi:hypothetical protein
MSTGALTSLMPVVPFKWESRAKKYSLNVIKYVRIGGNCQFRLIVSILTISFWALIMYI